MTDSDYKRQVFKEAKQWKSGLYYGLRMPEHGGVTLCSLPAVTGWLSLDGITQAACLAIDGCGQLYLLDGKKCALYRYDATAGQTEQVCCFGGKGRGRTQLRHPRRMAVSRHTLWVAVPGDGRVVGFARENLQRVRVIDDHAEPVDIAIAKDGELFVLDRSSRKIYPYGETGRAARAGFGAGHLREPVAFALAGDGSFFVIDRQERGFLRFARDGRFLGKMGDFTSLGADFDPCVVCVNGAGTLYVGAKTLGGIHEFAADGSYLGSIPDTDGPVSALAFGCDGRGYFASQKGVAVLDSGQRYPLAQGTYYSKTLDSGTNDCRWHRLALQGDLPPKTVLEVFCYSSNDDKLQGKIDAILADRTLPAAEKKRRIDETLPEVAWTGPERDPFDMLFREARGRFLWLKLVLGTYDEKAAPLISHMTAYSPRTSYLRYLPAIYQEDPVSSSFLERFLSLFESGFFDLESEIGRLHELFDPSTNFGAFPDGAGDFLSWLGSWLNLALEEAWSEGKKRTLIGEAFGLYSRKGTVAGLTRLIEIYTGKAPRIVEQARAMVPMVLGKEMRLGVSTILTAAPIRGFRLGDDSILGRVAIRDQAYRAEDPFLPQVHRFVVLLDLTASEYADLRAGITRLLDAEKPAHTAYRLQLAGDVGPGGGYYIGINSRVDAYRCLEVGEAVLGAKVILCDDGARCGKVDRHGVVGVNCKLL